MRFIFKFLQGLAIGAGAILPGISSGVLCVVFGIYETLVNSILGFFQDWRKHLRFLLPILLGGITGILLFSNLLEFLFSYYPMQTKFSFIGFILGSIPVLLKKSNQKKGFQLHYFYYLFAALCFACILLFLEKKIGFYQETAYCVNTFSFSFLVLAGFLMSVGVVVPGVSSSVILMLLGVYPVYLSAVSMVNMHILFPMGIGLLLGSFLFLKLIQYLLQHHSSETYYAIIGFVLGSIPILYPGFTMNKTGISSLVCFIICFGISYFFEKKEQC